MTTYVTRCSLLLLGDTFHASSFWFAFLRIPAAVDNSLAPFASQIFVQPALQPIVFVALPPRRILAHTGK